MMKKLINILSIAILGTVLFSCSDNVNQYIPADVIYIVNSGENEILLYDTGEKDTYELGLYRAGKHGKSASASVAVLTDAELNAYNQENETDYKLIPSEYYTLTLTEVNFANGVAETNQYVPIEFNTPALQKLLEANKEVDYVLPIKISKASIEIQEEKDLSLLMPVVKDALVSMTTTGQDEFNITLGEPITPIDMKLGVSVPFENKWNIECNIALSQDALDRYNDENDTDLVLLPSEYYTLPSAVSIVEGSKNANFNVKVDATGLSLGSYALPIYIANTSNFEMDQSQNLYMLIVNVSAPVIDSEDFTVIYGTTYASAGEGSNGTFDKLFDGDLDTYWHSQWTGGTDENPANPPLPHDILIDMKKEYTIFQVDIARRKNNSATKAGEIYITNDDAFALVNAGKYDQIKWTKVGSFFMDTVNGFQPFMITESTTRFVLVKITESRNGNVTSLAGIEIRGY